MTNLTNSIDTINDKIKAPAYMEGSGFSKLSDHSTASPYDIGLNPITAEFSSNNSTTILNNTTKTFDTDSFSNRAKVTSVEAGDEMKNISISKEIQIVFLIISACIWIGVLIFKGFKCVKRRCYMATYHVHEHEDQSVEDTEDEEMGLNFLFSGYPEPELSEPSE